MVVFQTLVNVAVCVLLILVVLLQTGKRADLAGAFGGGGSGTAFGARGAATVLSKATTIGAVVFMLTSFGLSLLSTPTSSTGGSVLDQIPASSAPAPSTPAPGGAPPSSTAPPASDAPAGTTPVPTGP